MFIAPLMRFYQVIYNHVESIIGATNFIITNKSLFIIQQLKLAEYLHLLYFPQFIGLYLAESHNFEYIPQLIQP